MPAPDNQNQSKIDARQEAIKTALTAQEATPLYPDAESYADIFLNDVDAFQQTLASTEGLNEKASRKVLALLETALSPEIVKDLSEKLRSALNAFQTGLSSYKETKSKTHEVTTEDTLSKVVMSALNLKSWGEDPQRLFTGVRRLQEAREKTGSLPFIDEDGHFVLEKPEQGPDDPITGELWDPTLLADLAAPGSGSVEDMHWYAEQSPRYGRKIAAVARTLEETASDENISLQEPSAPQGKPGKKSGPEASSASDDLDESVASIDNALGGQANPETSNPNGDKVLAEQQALRDAETAKVLAEETIKGFLTGLKSENAKLSKTVAAQREEVEGWAGYGHALEPSNLAAGAAGAFNWLGSGGVYNVVTNPTNPDAWVKNTEGFATKETVSLQLSSEFLKNQQAAERGLTTLLKTMRGSESRDEKPLTLQEAWASLSKSGNPDFNFFRGSPEGRLFERTVIAGKESTDQDEAQYFYEKGMDLVGRVGKEEAAVYFQNLLEFFPGSPYASKARANLPTASEEAYQTFTSAGDVMLRLDTLAVVAGSAGVGAVLKGTRLGAGTASLLTKYPQLAKVIPGVNVLRAGEKANGVVRAGLGFGNFVLEMGKFGAYVGLAEQVGGEKAAYAMGMLCSLTPGLVHGFEGKSLKQLLGEGSSGIKRLGTYISEQVGGPKKLAAALVESLEAQARAAGAIPDKTLITKRVFDTLKFLGLDAVEAASKSAVKAGTESLDSLSKSLASVDFKQILNGIKTLPDVAREVFGAFEAQWTSLSASLKTMLASKEPVTAAAMKDIRARVTTLMDLFRKLPASTKETLAPHLQKLREFLAALSARSKSRASSTAETVAETAPRESDAEALLIEVRAAAEASEHLLAELRRLGPPSPEFLAQIGSETRAALQSRLNQARTRISYLSGALSKSYTGAVNLTDVETWNSIVKTISNDYAGGWKTLANTAKTQEERQFFLKEFLKHAKAEESAVAARLRELAEAAARPAAQAGQSMEAAVAAWRESLRAYETPSFGRMSVNKALPAASLKELMRGYAKTLDSYREMLNRPAGPNQFAGFEALPITSDHSGQLQTLARNTTTDFEKRAILETAAAHMEAQMRFMDGFIDLLENVVDSAKDPTLDAALKDIAGGITTSTPKASIQKVIDTYLWLTTANSGTKEVLVLENATGKASAKTLLCKLLGLTEPADAAALTKGARTFMKKFHPDKFSAEGVPAELKPLAEALFKTGRVWSENEIVKSLFASATAAA